MRSMHGSSRPSTGRARSSCPTHGFVAATRCELRSATFGPKSVIWRGHGRSCDAKRPHSMIDADGLRPVIAERLATTVERLRTLDLDDERYRPEVPAAIVDAGLHRICLPVEAGGLGAGLREV